jgi:voltage-gated potassium channel
MRALQQRAYDFLFEAPENDRAAETFQTAIMALIALNVCTSILETESTIRVLAPSFFIWVENLSVAVFTLEYLGRIWCCTVNEKYAHPFWGRVKCATSPMAVIDALAIAPFYLQTLIPNLDLRFVRALRLFRLFRIFKLGRWSSSFQTIVHVVQSRYEEIAVSMLIVLIATVLSGSIMWMIEAEAQPEKFRSIPAGIWWAIISITTIGYGDVAPITPIGKFMGGIIAVLGICIFALPVGVLGAGFVEEMARKKGRTNARISPFILPNGDPTDEVVPCPHCGKHAYEPVTNEGRTADR